MAVRRQGMLAQLARSCGRLLAATRALYALYCRAVVEPVQFDARLQSCSMVGLVQVVINMKVSSSAFEPNPKNAVNISAGDAMTLSFLADPTPTERRGISDPSIIVHDAKAPPL